MRGKVLSLYFFSTYRLMELELEMEQQLDRLAEAFSLVQSRCKPYQRGGRGTHTSTSLQVSRGKDEYIHRWTLHTDVLLEE